MRKVISALTLTILLVAATVVVTLSVQKQHREAEKSSADAFLAETPAEEQLSTASDQEAQTSDQTKLSTKIEGTAPTEGMPISPYDLANIYGNTERVKKELYDVCWYRPEALAVTLSAFPRTVCAADRQRDQPFGIEEVDPWILDELISCDPRGREIQEWLLEVLQEILDSNDTTWEFHRAQNSWQLEYYLFFPRGANVNKLDPSEVGIVDIPIYRTDDPQVIMGVKVPGDVEAGTFNLRTGLAYCQDVDLDNAAGDEE